MYCHNKLSMRLFWVLCWCLFPMLFRNSGNKHQNNTGDCVNSFLLLFHALFSKTFVVAVAWNDTDKYSTY